MSSCVAAGSSDWLSVVRRSRRAETNPRGERAVLPLSTRSGRRFDDVPCCAAEDRLWSTGNEDHREHSRSFVARAARMGVGSPRTDSIFGRRRELWAKIDQP